MHGEIFKSACIRLRYGVFLLAFAMPAFAQEPQPSIISDAQLHRMLVARIDGQRQGTGIVVGIIDPKGKRVLAYGTMGVGDTRPVGGDTVFDLGSITKVFTALALSEMVQRGEVALDDPVQKYLTGGCASSYPRRQANYPRGSCDAHGRISVGPGQP